MHVGSHLRGKDTFMVLHIVCRVGAAPLSVSMLCCNVEWMSCCVRVVQVGVCVALVPA